MKYSKSIEMYCANPIGEKEISEITSINSARDSRLDQQKLIYKSTCYLLLVASVGFFSYVVAIGNAAYGIAIIPFVFTALLLTSFAYLMALDIATIKHKVYINVFGCNFAAESDFFEQVEVIYSGQVSSSLAKELILNINKQGRKMFSFERDIVKRLCEI